MNRMKNWMLGFIQVAWEGAEALAGPEGAGGGGTMLGRPC